MKCVLADSLNWLYPDRLDQIADVDFMTLDVPQNGIASVNVVLKDIAEKGTVRFHAGSADAKMDWKISLYRLHDIPVEFNTGLVGFCEKEETPNPYVVRKAPFRVYDAMEPLQKVSFTVDKGNTVLQVHIPVPASCKAGTYEIILYFNQQSVTVRLQVYPVSLMPCGKNSFFYTNWYSTANIWKRHGLENNSAAYFKMLKKYAE